MPDLSRPIMVGVLGGLLLAGCVQRPLSKAPQPVGSSDGTAASLDGTTGIAACDDYLSSYLACHRVARLYPPDQLQSRYEAMRSILLQDSENPQIRPQLAARCNSLSTQLRQRLQGNSCAETPAPATSSR